MELAGMAAAHNPVTLAAACALCFANGYLIAIYLQQMRSLTLRRRLALLVIASSVSGLTMWTVSHLLVASYVPHLPKSFDGISVAFQIAVCVLYYTALSASSFSAVRWHHRAGLFLVPFFPALLNFWAVNNLVGTGVADAGVFLRASAWFAFGGGLMSLTAPKNPARDVAPPVPFAAVQVGVMLILHFSMLMAYGLGPDMVAQLGKSPDTIASMTLLLPVAVANVLMMAVSSASFFADHEATQEAVRRYRALALRDRLTGLPNRAAMHAEIEDRLAAGRSPDRFAVALIDLDRFKEVNDIHGHAAGDELLISLSRFLLSRFGQGEALYRLGGDEFVALKLPVGSRGEALAFGQSVCDAVRAFETPVTGDIKVGASIGVSVHPEDGTTASELLSRADLAMYAAKRGGRNLSIGFDPDMETDLRRKTELSFELAGAIARKELALHYQPQVDAVSRDIVGFEALLRWSHPRLGMVEPSEFIPIAEESGQVIEIGEWVLREACREAATWPGNRHVSVNIAPGQLARDNFAAVLQDALAAACLPSSRLELEVTEAGFKKDRGKAVAVLKRCQGMGVTVTMDDFGTGQSSLSMLLECRFDRLKIDRRFIRQVTCDDSSSVIVKAVLALAAANGISVVAEGVETEAQRDFLLAEGCDLLQGYLFGAAVSAEDLRSRFPASPEAGAGAPRQVS
ncbi:putative bifunctional diguanylate cyclase/phosphodiesterase [Mangrovicoccus ximenensis]|uniref:putative bifunctional diguanylate cyclase/phosphodiesterase n=1 Tax=Mangrovicoccus ximenensis TaxID=1911570 RepID=UPI000D349EC5|nr:EAL domain-containing protein [Mangrovicoccus ximenensis]